MENSGAQEWAKVLLAMSAKAGNAEEVENLLFAGADPNAGMPGAVSNGHAGIVERLLRAGADPNAKDARGWPLLHMAAANGRAAAVEALLRFGAEAGERGPDGSLAEDRAGEKGMLEKLREARTEGERRKLEGALEKESGNGSGAASRRRL